MKQRQLGFSSLGLFLAGALVGAASAAWASTDRVDHMDKSDKPACTGSAVDASLQGTYTSVGGGSGSGTYTLTLAANSVTMSNGTSSFMTAAWSCTKDSATLLVYQANDGLYASKLVFPGNGYLILGGEVYSGEPLQPSDVQKLISMSKLWYLVKQTASTPAPAPTPTPTPTTPPATPATPATPASPSGMDITVSPLGSN